jgi:transposase-like protein
MNTHNGKSHDVASQIEDTGSTIESHPESVPMSNPEVLERPTRRHFTAAFKRKILAQTDDLAQGEVAAFLRREGLYWSQLAEWRKLREKGALAGPQSRAKEPEPTRVSRRESQLEKKNAELEEELRIARIVMDVQKKVLSLCERTGSDDGTSSRS